MDWGEIGSMIAVFGSVGSFLIWLYKQIVQKPDQRIQKQATDRIIQSEKDTMAKLERTISPLSHQIETLNNLLKESQEDRDQIHGTLKKHDRRIDENKGKITDLGYRVSGLEKRR